MIQLLERFLDVTSRRHSLVVSNMANVDTPGYRTKDLDFRSELVRAVNNGGQDVMPVARNVQGLLERPDGNNVSLDRESLLMAETQIQFRLGVQLIRSEFQRLITAINEGGKQG
jgi:flagellar basal-body rod protein FlgB